MKKIFLLSMIFSSILLFTSCGSSGNESSIKNNNNEEKIILVFGTQDNINSPGFVGYQAFADKLYELSQGTMLVEFTQMIKFDGVEQMINSVLEGQFDIVAAGYSNLDYAIPDLFILSQVVRDLEHFTKILESPFGKKLQEQFHEVGVIPSNPWYMGTRRVTSNTPINELADFKKLKMRTVPTKAGQVFASNMGAEVVPLNFPELYDALANGTVNAQENPMSVIESAKLYEHQKYIAITEHVISITAVLLNKAKYDTFTTSQKVWYNEAINYGGQVSTDIVLENEASILDKFINEYGMIATYPNLAELRAAMAPHFDSLKEEYGNIITELLAIE